MEEVSSTSRCSPVRSKARLPTPPPDPRYLLPDNCKDQSDETNHLPADFRSLIKRSQERESFLQNQLQQSLAEDCRKHCHGCSQEVEGKQGLSATCNCCQEMCGEFNALLKPLREQFQQSLSAVVCSYNAIEQVNRLYALWDHYITIDRDLQRRRECLSYLKLLQNKFNDVKGTFHYHVGKEEDFSSKKNSFSGRSDIEVLDQSELDLQQSIILIEAALNSTQNSNNSNTSNLNKSLTKLQRERSKSVMMPAQKADELYEEFRNSVSTNHADLQQFLRRQSAYKLGKSKVSKWTKVKAAFKWEKVNLSPTSIAVRKSFPLSTNTNTNTNTDLIKHLRVPSLPCGGGSSADSILSSSSGHVLSEIGGTFSSASSIDDMNKDIVPRRDSSQSDIGQRATPSISLSKLNPRLVCEKSAIFHKPLRASCVLPTRQISEVAVQQDTLMETLENPNNLLPKIRQPPSPLDLNLKQDLNNLEISTHHLQVDPSDQFSLLYRVPKAYRTPVNSSVPSSPSKYSHFLMGFESEDISSGGNVSESSLLTQELRDRQSSELQEINHNYHTLRVKLEQEFEDKRKEWDKLKLNQQAKSAKSAQKSASGSMLTTLTNARAISPNRRASQKLLEENLTPEFKKKLQKWRVMKQTSMTGTTSAGAQLINSNSCANNSGAYSDIGGSNSIGNSVGRIDWNLWKMGQLKLDGQGLSVLPDQKNLSEDFQKKLEQWKKIKQGGINNKNSKTNHHHILSKKNDTSGELKKSESKQMYKEKSERLAKLKAMVDEYPAKRIEVKTADGVLKFEGISRKFTRKLYEWEKARGIDPESSTFALLHPGYCPLDVKRIPNEITNKQDSSPTLNRSLSLSSISASVANNVSSASCITQQTSSLSLNDVNDLKAMTAAVATGTSAEEDDEDINNSTKLTSLQRQEKAYQSTKNEEPEAVMVEVEDHIEETGSPFISTNIWPKKQMPIYKYEEIKCKDYCSTKRIQSFETHLNELPLATVLSSCEKLIKDLQQNPKTTFMTVEDSKDYNNYFTCKEILQEIRKNYPFYCEHLIKPPILNVISDVQTKLNRIRYLSGDISDKEEEQLTYHQELQGLYNSLRILQQRLLVEQQNIQCVSELPNVDVLVKKRPLSPAARSSHSSEWNDSGLEGAVGGVYEPTSELAESSTPEDTVRQTKTVINTYVDAANIVNSSGCKKKTRLRRIGSRQSSKTESPSSEDENNINPISLETPRRLRRKYYRSKQRSLEEDFRLWKVSESIPYFQHPPEIKVRINESTTPRQEGDHIIEGNMTNIKSLSLPNISSSFSAKQTISKKKSKIYQKYNFSSYKQDQLDSIVFKSLSYDQFKEQLTCSNRSSLGNATHLQRNQKRWKEESNAVKSMRHSLESNSSDTIVDNTELRPMTALGVMTDSKNHLRPTTPLTERAWHLKQAKEAFLRGDQYIFPQDRKNLEKQSDLSLSSTPGEDESNAISSCQISKAFYNQVTRSEHITSKRGFAALASKLKKVTRHDNHNCNNKYDETSVKNNSTQKEVKTALSTLCRHSLLSSNIMTTIQVMPKLSATCKSNSSPHAVLKQHASEVETEANTDQELAKENLEKLALKRLTTEGSLNKSQSEKSFKSPKESRV